jgi:hypothetical protein
MKKRRKTIQLTLILAVCFLFLSTSHAFCAEIESLLGQPAGMAKFDNDGKLLLPSDYRTWVFVGAAVTPNEMNQGEAPFPEFHTIYMDPLSYRVFKKTGEFPEGTVMIKETQMIAGKKAPSGNGYFMGDFVLLAAGVKDTKRFAGKRAGWGFFAFGKPTDPRPKSEVLPVAECNNCHNAAAKEQVFIQYYPVLQAVEKK